MSKLYIPYPIIIKKDEFIKTLAQDDVLIGELVKRSSEEVKDGAIKHYLATTFPLLDIEDKERCVAQAETFGYDEMASNFRQAIEQEKKEYRKQNNTDIFG
jgi:hypothetical protein